MLGMTIDDDRPTPEDYAKYLRDVDELEQWYRDLITQYAEWARHSDDTFMDLDNLADRIKAEGIEGVANGGMPEGTLYEEEFSEKFGEVCDVVERTFGGMPLERADVNDWEAGNVDGNDPLLHTSDEARAAASKIFEILGITSVD